MANGYATEDGDYVPTAQPIQLSPFHKHVWLGDGNEARTMLKKDRRLLDTVDPTTGLTALHIAVGRNNLPLTKVLVEAGAAFIPDAQGRMPSVIATELEVSEELAHYICEAESRALKSQEPEDV